MREIEYNKQFGGLAFQHRGQMIPRIANIEMSPQLADRIFPGIAEGRNVLQTVEAGEPFETPFGSIQFLNNTLGAEMWVIGEDTRVDIVGNTVFRRCGHGGESGCRECPLAQLPVSNDKLVKANCAAGNTKAAFLEVNQQERGRFMLTPTSDNVLLVDNKTTGIPVNLTDENNKRSLAFSKLPAARAVIFGEQWAKEQGLKSITAGINGADSTFGIMSLRVRDENFVVVFCTTRENLGDRDKEAEILKKSIDAIFDKKEIPQTERENEFANLNVRIDLGASATLSNFEHKIRIPTPGTRQSRDYAKYYGIDESEFARRYTATSKVRWISGELEKENIAQSTREELQRRLAELKDDAITPSKVMDSLYPGALDNGFVFSPYEAKHGGKPRTREGCPGYEESCFLAYREITFHSIKRQLKGIGNIEWHEERAVDPAESSNNFPSNRLEQLADVEISKTNRTFNGAQISL